MANDMIKGNGRLKLATIALAGVAIAGCASPCDLAAGLAARAGDGAKNCGHATFGSDASAVDACVIDAFQGGTPFVAQYDRQGTDSKVVFGMAGDAHGAVTFLTWDGDPSGGSGADPVISGLVCLTPSVDPSPTRDPGLAAPLTCASSVSLGRTCG